MNNFFLTLKTKVFNILTKNWLIKILTCFFLIFINYVICNSIIDDYKYADQIFNYGLIILSIYPILLTLFGSFYGFYIMISGKE